MKRKIYWNICGTAIVAVLLSFVLSTVFYYYKTERQMRREVLTEVQYLESALELSGIEYLENLSQKMGDKPQNRITLIQKDGVVLYDNYTDSTTMENHGKRPEVQDALTKGVGQNTRISETLSEQTYYYAARLSNGNVIRGSVTIKSVIASICDLIPWMVIVTIIVSLMSMLVAERQTKKIVKPINELDLDEPEKELVYDELSPLLRRIQKQNDMISRQMDLLKEKKKEFTAITEQMQEGFLIINRQEQVVSHNSSALRILGFHEDDSDLNGMNILHFNRSEEFGNAVKNALEGRHAEYILEIDERTYQMIVSPVKDHQGDYAAIVIILDVSEKQKRELLRKEFSANVSHELKTPLTSILGYAEMLKNGLVKPEDKNRFLERIYGEAKRMVTLIEDIMQLSKLDEHTEEMEFHMVDIYEVARRVTERRRDQAGQRNITLHLEGSHTNILGVEHILDEMIDNLCDNAIKYNVENGSVTVFAGLADNRPAIRVSDTGIGVAETESERIFERFYRSDKSHSKKIEGTGLGLSIVKRGAICHKAQIHLDSKEGKGTKIEILFQ